VRSIVRHIEKRFPESADGAGEKAIDSQHGRSSASPRPPHPSPLPRSTGGEGIIRNSDASAPRLHLRA
jgi:hypothetical protein